eukprot:GILI01009637.1.p1 GENE.GILI01009637.1~~GILI01009637.1.p1  ORF type:complete len:449 (+),score=107.89 GILI01009637.1:53-1399(+)
MFLSRCTSSMKLVSSGSVRLFSRQALSQPSFSLPIALRSHKAPALNLNTLALRRPARPFSTTATPSASTTEAVVESTKARFCVPGTEKAIGTWLAVSAGLVFTMVGLGGYTRLTRAGLSMVDWRPQGSAPPSTEEAWEAEFNKYKQFPEYQKVNKGMSLEEFKKIFYIEWFHRMWGRFTGVVFTVPLAYFLARGYIKKPLLGRLALMFGMGGTQGLIGWWMVKSGLEQPKDYQIPRVSPYRLATHLGSAFVIYSYVFWNALNLLRADPAVCYSTPEAIAVAKRVRSFALPLTALIALTALSGAFVAGLDAGHAYNSFPKMGDHWIPPESFDLKPTWLNVFENTALVQFDHRVLATTTLSCIAAFWAFARRQPLHPTSRKLVHGLLHMGLLQVTLGISTLLLYVPVDLGVAHQCGALTLLSIAIFLCHSLRIPPASAMRLARQMVQKAA